jgi:Aerolysin toxin
MSSDYQTPWAGQAAVGGKAQSIALASNSSAGPAAFYRLELFSIGTDSKLYHYLQDPKKPNGWGSPTLLAGAAKTLAVTNLVDGNVVVFYTDANDVLHYKWQDPKKPGGWDGPTLLGGKANLIATTSNGGGGLEVFYTGPDLQLYHQFQPQANGDWSVAEALAPSVIAVTATRDINGTPVIFYIDTHATLSTLLMIPGQQPIALAGNAGAPLALTNYASGGLALFYIASTPDRTVHHYYQPTPNTPWIHQMLANIIAKTITAARMVDDTLTLFSTDVNDTLFYSWPQEQQAQQAPPDVNLSWSPVLLGGATHTATSLVAASNADGRLELFYIGTDGQLYHNWQVYNWQTLQNAAAARTGGAHIIDDQPQPAPGATNSTAVFGLDPSQRPGLVTWIAVTWWEPADKVAFLMSIEWTSVQGNGNPVPFKSVFLPTPPVSGPPLKKATFAFLENETLSECTLYTNSGLMAGIEFETSRSRTFSAGNLKLDNTSTIKLSEVAAALLMGFYGCSNLVPFNTPNDPIPELSSLGLWISRVVKAISVQNVRYDLGRATITNQQTQSLNTIELVNDSGEPQTVSEGTTYTLESSSNWSHAQTATQGSSVSLNIGYIPASETGGIAFGLTYTGNIEQSITESTGGERSQSTNYTYTASATVPAHSKLNVEVACTRAILSVPYVADVIVTYADGSTAQINTSPGTYTGVQNYDIQATYTTPGGTPVQQVAIG